MRLALGSLAFLAAPLQAQITEQVRLDGGGSLGEQFGSAVALDGDRGLVSAPFDDEAAMDAGAVHVVERDATGGWSSVFKLLATGARASDQLGLTSVDLEGGRALLGAPYADVGNPLGGVDQGVAKIFERQPDASWLEVATLCQTAFSKVPGGFQFGWSVSLFGDRALVGSPKELYSGSPVLPNPTSGAAYVFEREVNGEWSLVSRLVPSDPDFGMNFGGSVALGQFHAVVGARFADGASEEGAGAVYLFELQFGGGYLESERLTAPDGEFLDQFGLEVDLDGDRLLVGTGVESAYVYGRDRLTGAWSQEARLTSGSPPSTTGLADCFGCAVSLSGDRALVGAIREDAAGVDRGVLHAFARQSNGTWLPAATATASDGEDGDQLGLGVALDGDRVLAGARLVDGAASEAGAAYVFDVEPLSSDVDTVVVTRGGIQPLALDAGRVHAGRAYALVGSRSGTMPGLLLQSGLVLPLNPDPYFQLTLHSPDDSPLTAARGTLDARGHATSAFEMGVGDVALAGFELHHAFVVFDGGVVFVSNPRFLELALSRSPGERRRGSTISGR